MLNLILAALLPAATGFTTNPFRAAPVVTRTAVYMQAAAPAPEKVEVSEAYSAQARANSR